MTAASLVAEIRALGVELEPVAPDRLRIRPAGAISSELKARLMAHKAEVLALLNTGSRDGAKAPDPALVARMLGMPLDVFAQVGQPIEIRVPWWPATLFLVPDVRHAEALWAEGIERARVWTSAELQQLLEGQPWARE